MDPVSANSVRTPDLEYMENFKTPKRTLVNDRIIVYPDLGLGAVLAQNGHPIC